MATVVIAPTALADLDEPIRVLKLPPDTRPRVRARLARLAEFPESGEKLEGHRKDFRFILGRWRWTLILYAFDEAADHVSIVTIQDSRSALSATSGR